MRSKTLLAIPSMYAALASAECETAAPTLRYALSTSEALSAGVSELSRSVSACTYSRAMARPKRAS